MKKSEILFTLSRIINDIATIFGGLIVAYYLRMERFSLFHLTSPTPFSLEQFLPFALSITATLLGIFALQGRYHFYQDEKIFDEINHVFWSFSAGMALVLVAFFFLKHTFFSRFIFGVAWIISLTLLLSGRMTLRIIRRQMHKLGLGKVRIIILGTGNIAAKAIHILKQNPKFQILGLVSEKKLNHTTAKGVPVIGGSHDFETILKKHKPNEILIATEDPSEKISATLIQLAYLHETKLSYLPDELGLDLASVSTSTLGNLPLITLQNTKLHGWGLLIKSGFDYVFSLLMCVLLSPILLIISLLVWLENKTEPIFYASIRIGKNGHPFLCYKFRTMIPEAEKQKKKLEKQNERKGSILFKMKNDPRITPLGKKLRELSLDELPQLFNILKGDMSLIGPRPHLQEEVEKYGQNDLRVLSIKPGLTGFSQINGRSALSFEEEISYELFYLKNWSLLLDFIIFFKSIWVIVQKKNVS